MRMPEPVEGALPARGIASSKESAVATTTGPVPPMFWFRDPDDHAPPIVEPS
jgi:hypothetical protein